MSDYIAVTSADSLLKTASEQLGEGNHIKVRSDGDQVSWSVDKLRSVKQVLTFGLYGRAQAKDFKAGLTTLANQAHNNFSSAERNKGNEASVSFGEHRIAAGAFADNVARIKVSNRGSFARAVQQSPIWGDVRHVAAPNIPTVAELEQQRQAAATAKAEGRERLETGLENWARRHTSDQTQAVVDLVLEAYDNDATELRLGDFELRSIPPLGELTKLDRLGLQNNKLTSLDSLQANATLAELDLTGNPLFTLPADLGVRLPSLETLNISNTLVSKVPPDLNLPRTASVVADRVPFLTQEAVRIVTRNTESDRLTHRFPDDHELLHARGGRHGRGLNLQNVREAAHLRGVSADEALERTRAIRSLDTTPFGPPAVAAGQAKINQHTSLEQNVAFYYQSLGREVPPGLIAKLKEPLQSSSQPPSDDQWDNLRRDLSRFTQIKGALSSSEKTTDLARRVVAILDSAVESEAFREHLFSIAGDASSECEDRAAVGLGRLEQEAYLLKAVSRETIDPAEIRQLFRETAIVQEATTLATEKGIARHEKNSDASTDEIEWVLSYLTVLRDRGHLSFGSSDLHYRSNYGFEVAEVRADIPKILDKAKGAQAVSITLQRVPSWADKLSDLWEPFKQEKAALVEAFDNQVLELDDQLTEGSITEEQYASLLNQLGPKRADALAALTEKHTEQWLAAKG